jgi:hypothetical protein
MDRCQPWAIRASKQMGASVGASVLGFALFTGSAMAATPKPTDTTPKDTTTAPAAAPEKAAPKSKPATKTVPAKKAPAKEKAETPEAKLRNKRLYPFVKVSISTTKATTRGPSPH